MEEPAILVLLLAETFVSMIRNFKQVRRARGWDQTWNRVPTLTGELALIHFWPCQQGSPGSSGNRKETLEGFVTDVTARAGGKALSLVIVDQEKGFRCGFLRTGVNGGGDTRQHGSWSPEL